MKEIWKSIEGYEGLYEVSNIGNVRSLRHKVPKILNPMSDKDGYYLIDLSKNNHKKRYRIHRLVAMAFVEKSSKDHNLINHKNEIKTDNRATNLEWCDAKYNTNYNEMPLRRADWCKKPIIAKKGNDVLRFESVTQAAKELGCSHGNISGCLLGYHGRKTIKGYYFEYENEASK